MLNLILRIIFLDYIITIFILFYFSNFFLTLFLAWTKCKSMRSHNWLQFTRMVLFIVGRHICWVCFQFISYFLTCDSIILILILFSLFLYRGIGCGIYATNSPEACEYVLKDSKSQIVVVENKMQLLKILKAKEKGLQIKKIIQYSGPVENGFDGLVIDVI